MALRSNYVLGFAVDEGGQERRRGLERLRKRPRNQSWAAQDATLMLKRPPHLKKKVKDRKGQQLRSELKWRRYCMPPGSLR
jgi:hypothetical protein